METLKSMLYALFFFVVTMTLTSVMGKDYQEEQRLHQVIHEQEMELDGMFVDRCWLETTIQSQEELLDYVSSPEMLAKHMTKFRKELKLHKKSGELRTFPGTMIYVKEWVLPDLTTGFTTALLDLPLETTFLMTSGRRFSNCRSHHWHRQAIDVRLDADGKAFAEWLISDEGSHWREEYSIGFYIEDRYTSRYSIFKDFSDEHFEPFFYINPLASGPHIHMWCTYKV
jgi:hypothetical protein